MRGFEVVKRLEGKDVRLPERSTENSAGYDFFAIEPMEIPYGKIVLVKTGIKAYMQKDEVLYLYNRSSNPKKKGLVVMNGVGVIDADYYGNKDNDGEICFMLMNVNGSSTVFIEPGDRIGQGVFHKFLLADGDNASGTREGGFGSTGE
jgi:dUTP pyrophosphatase